MNTSRKKSSTFANRLIDNGSCMPDEIALRHCDSCSFKFKTRGPSSG